MDLMDLLSKAGGGSIVAELAGTLSIGSDDGGMDDLLGLARKLF